MRFTTIPVSTEVRNRLRLLANGETYDAILRRVIREAEMLILKRREKRILETEEFTPLDGA